MKKREIEKNDFEKYVFILFMLIHTILISYSQPLSHPGNSQAGGTGSAYYENPILAGDYPDPSVLRVEDDYYMTNSSFEYYPGLLIWHSKDLVNWEPVCRALHKYVGSVYAPDFIKFRDRYFIYFPANSTNWVITAQSPEGPWSDPIDLKVGNIDPGHVVGQDGKRYLHLSGGYLIQLADDGLSTVGELIHSYDGWPIPENWEVACTCLESPKLTYKDGYYYLTTAEGGTVGPATAHMVVSARSKTPVGPWENSPCNPVVHTYYKDDKWHAKGHGSLIEDKYKKWWIVYHAYENGFYTLARQTLMEPIEWTEDGWFRVPSLIRTDLPIRKPQGEEVAHGMVLSDDFSGKELGIQWSFFKNYDISRVSINNGALHFRAQGTSPPNSTPLLCIPTHHSYEVQVEYELVDGATGGIVLFYNPDIYAGIVTDGQGFSIYRRGQAGYFGKNEMGSHGFLKIVNIENTVSFYYSPDSRIWQKIERSVVTDSYNHTAFGGFLSLRIGLVSIGTGCVTFDNFVYNRIN